MDHKIQLLSFFVSFIFGIFFYITNYFNKKLIHKEKILFQYINTILFIINIVLLYIILIYKINQGVFHIYFIFVTVIGYLIALFNLKNVKKYVKSLKRYIKSKRKVI